MEESQLEAFRAVVPPLGNAPWRPWFEHTEETDTVGTYDFCVRHGLLATTLDLGLSPSGTRGYTVSIAAKSPEALARLANIIPPDAWVHGSKPVVAA
jgi:hypothetical protein